MKLFQIITIFPNLFDSYFSDSIIGRAVDSGKINIRIHDLRKWSEGKHKTVDDRPYGGGAGMVFKPEPLVKALNAIKTKRKGSKPRIVLLSAKGKIWDQNKAKNYMQYDEVILICGRYEGVDERIRHFIDEEISIGKYVLTGGEIPAMVIVDSMARLVSGVLGNDLSAQFESYSDGDLLEHPHYTRPEVLEIDGKRYVVPKVLLSGDHKKIAEWRKKQNKK